MSRLATALLCALLASWTVMVQPVAAASRTAADTVLLGAKSNGETVTFEGEAIGEALRAEGGHKWVNVLSGGTALGVVMTSEQVALIQRFGRYQSVGDTVEVTGVYNVGCDEHGGEIDVHATQVTVIEAGYHDPEPPHLWQLGVSVGLFAAATVTALRFRQARRRYERA